MKIFMLRASIQAPSNSPIDYQNLNKEMLGRGFRQSLQALLGNIVPLPQGEFVIGVLETKHSPEAIAGLAKQAAQIATKPEHFKSGFPFRLVCVLAEGMPFVFAA